MKHLITRRGPLLAVAATTLLALSSTVFLVLKGA